MENIVKFITGGYKMETYKAYVDGSYKCGLCGYGVVIVGQANNIVTKLCGHVGDEHNMHNITGELKAAQKAVLWALENNVKVTIYHDYEGIGAWATGKWKAKKAGTVTYRQFMRQHREHVEGFVKVKGHSGDIYNEMADQLATEGLEGGFKLC